MSILLKFVHSINTFQLRNKPLLLAVSGGVDSVVLAELCHQTNLQFAIAHCNFGLRDEESERDETFVNSLAKKYDVELYVKRFNTKDYAENNKLSIQEAARKLRYDWFEKVRTEKQFACTLLAHHANDNIESLLMNFFRGTGLDGLIGMPAEKKEAHCLRPMLTLTREEIELFAIENKLQWVEDSSNQSIKYTRNFFRNELLPAIKKVYPKVEENLRNNINRFTQTNILHKQLVYELKEKIIERRGVEVYIPVLKLMKYKHTSLLYDIIADYGFGEGSVSELLKLAEAESGKYIAAEHYRIIKHRKWFIIAPKAIEAQTFIINKEDELLLFGDGELRFKKISADKFVIQKDAALGQLDASRVEFPLLLRKWKTGDYFYPLGMQKKKKLGRFFIDLKLSKTQKEAVWVLESHGKIIWVVGYRIDDRFKVSASTKQVFLITQKSRTGT